MGQKDQEVKIKEFLDKLQEYQLSKIPEQDVLEEQYQLSNIFYRKMEKLFRQQEKKAKRKKYMRGFSMTAAIVLLFFLLSHPQYVAEAGNRVIQWFSDHVSFHFEEDANINRVNRYEMGYVPGGYELESDEYYDIAGQIAYRDKENRYIYLIYGILDGEVNLDNEEKRVIVLMGERGEVIYYLKAQDGEESSITWINEEKTTEFSVIGILSEEELLDIQRNVRILEK